jgi:hypothetical protein
LLATKLGLGSIYLLQLPSNIDLSYPLLSFELPAVLLLFDPPLNIGANVLHLVRRQKLHELVLIHAYLAECILLSSRSERVLLQLPPVNTLFYLWAVTGLLSANGLARLLLVHIHPLLKRVLVGVYTIQYAYDVPINSELAMDFWVRLSPIGRSDRHSDPLLALPAYHSADPVRLLIPIAITRSRRRRLLLNETYFGATILRHFR